MGSLVLPFSFMNLNNDYFIDSLLGTEEYPWDWKNKTKQFVKGLRLAANLKENLIFA